MTTKNTVRFGGDLRWAKVCGACYLSECYQDFEYLKRYCPINLAKRYKVEPAVILEIVKTTPTNRRWQFRERVAAGRVE